MHILLMILAIVSVAAEKENVRVRRHQQFFYLPAEEIVLQDQNELSAPGCPSSLGQGLSWMYYKTGETINCYLVGSSGPCGRGQVFAPKPGTFDGYCLQLHSQESCKDGEWLVRTPDNKYRCETRNIPGGNNAIGNDPNSFQPSYGAGMSTLSDTTKCKPNQVKSELGCTDVAKNKAGFS